MSGAGAIPLMGHQQRGFLPAPTESLYAIVQLPRKASLAMVQFWVQDSGSAAVVQPQTQEVMALDQKHQGVARPSFDRRARPCAPSKLLPCHRPSQAQLFGVDASRKG